MTKYVEYLHTNPNGKQVRIWHHPNFDPSNIGDGANIGAWAIIGAMAYIGDGAIIGAMAKIGDGANIGARANIGAGAKIGYGAIIGADVNIGRKGRIAKNDQTTHPIYCAPLPLGPKDYFVTMTSENLAIGCEIHPLKDWFEFDDKRILAMDGKQALKYWRAYRDIFRAMAVTNGWLPDDPSDNESFEVEAGQ